MLNSLWALPVVIAIRFIRRFVLIKITMLQSERFGGLVLYSTIFLRRYKKEKGVLELYGVNDVSNIFWIQMIKRSGLPVYGSWLKYLFFWNNFLPNPERYKISQENMLLYDQSNWNFEYKKFVTFYDNEKERGQEWLRNHGWHVGQPYVCIIVRDSAYLADVMPPKSERNWDHHEYRDSDINTYTKGIKWLIKEGYLVIRMGSKMLNPIQFTDKNLIDYAFCDEKSDFLDVWLLAECTYAISTGTGPDTIAAIYNKPILYINALPMNKACIVHRSTWVPKKLFKLDTFVPLTIEEYFLNAHSRTEHFSRNNILIKALEPNEILEYIIEFDFSVKSDFKIEPNNQLIQEQTWQLFFSVPENFEFQKYKHPKAIFSQIWISKNC